MATVRDVLKNKIDRLQERKARLLAEATAVQALIDSLQAERAALTIDNEACLDRLRTMGVIEAKD